MTRALVLTRDKVNDLLQMGLSAEEIALAVSTSAASIYSRRKQDPSRRSELDKRIGWLYLIVSEIRSSGLEDNEVVGWLTSPSLDLDTKAPLECLRRDQFDRVRAAAHSWVEDR